MEESDRSLADVRKDAFHAHRIVDSGNGQPQERAGAWISLGLLGIAEAILAVACDFFSIMEEEEAAGKGKR